MISKRPIYYTIIPSIVIIIGYIWYRRKRNGRIDCDSGGGSAEELNNTKNIKNINNNKSCKKLLDEGKLGDKKIIKSDQQNSSSSLLLNHSQQQISLPIGTPQSQRKNNNSSNNSSGKQIDDNSQGRQQSQSPSSAGSSSSSLSSKSAPINIAPNPRSPPKRITEQEIDCEILKLKPQESDIKNLRYIQEPDSIDNDDETPVSVDSPPYRSRFPGNNNNNSLTQSGVQEPIIVKGTMEAKISPENSFRERKYTQTESDDSTAGRINESETDNLNSNRKMDEMKNVKNISNDNGCVMMHEDDAEITEATNAENTMNNNNSNSNTGSAEPQIASPSLSICSMHSGDSGQGSSPPQSVGAPTITYDFFVPNSCVGVIIGNRGKTVARIKEKTGASVIIRKGFYGTKRQKVCSVEGTQSEIDAALKMIRSIIPDKKIYNSITMERVFVTPDNKIMPSFNIASLQLNLIEGINNDVSICSVVSGGHIFIQQPLHPTYPSLAPLQHRMNHWYSMTTAPVLPEVIDNAICAYFIQDNWYRVQIVSHNSETKMCVIKYLDFGGYTNVSGSELRQIHADFMTLPFQAIECVLSNVRPPNGQTEWSKESIDTVLSFTNGVILQAQVAGYTQDDIPEVLLFVAISKDNVLFINQELCARKLAEWIPNEEQV